MSIHLKKFKNLRQAFILSISAFVFAIALVSYAVWEEPLKTPPGGSRDAALTEGVAFQEKLGGLEINTDLKAGIFGLMVGRVGSGDGDSRVGIGTSIPEGKLHVVGNLRFSGDVRPQGTIGLSDQLLVHNDTNLIYSPDTAWLTIQRVDILDNSGGCIKVFPQCPDKWTFKEQIPDPGINPDPPCGTYGGTGGPPLAYGAALRICYQTISQQVRKP